MLNLTYVLVGYFKKAITSAVHCSIFERVFAQSKIDYFLVDFPLVAKTLSIAGRELPILGHHLTIPKEIGVHQSSVHFTMVLEGKIEIHLYFDALDRYTVDKTLTLSNTSETISLSQADIDNLLLIAMPFFVPFMFQLREKQQGRMDALENTLTLLEDKMILLSEDLSNNKDEYVKLVKQQVTLIENMKQLGRNDYSKEWVWYQSVLTSLNQMNMAVTPNASAVSTSTAGSASSSSSTSLTLPVSAFEPKQKVNEGQQFIVKCEKLLRDFKVVDNKTPLIAPLIQLHSAFLIEELVESAPAVKIQMLRNRVLIKQALLKFFKEVRFVDEASHILRALYWEACKERVFKCEDRFIRDVLLSDDAVFLQRMIKSNLIFETDRYALTCDPAARYTLLEWSVCFKRYGSAKMLMLERFSPDYQTLVNSPIARLNGNFKEFELFVQGMDVQNCRQTMVASKRRQLALLNQQIQNVAAHDPSRELLVLNRDLCECAVKMGEIFARKPFLQNAPCFKKLRDLESADRLYRTSAIRDAVFQDVELVRLSRDYAKALLRLISNLKYEQRGLLGYLSKSEMIKFDDLCGINNLKIDEKDIQAAAINVKKILKATVGQLEIYNDLLVSSIRFSVSLNGAISLSPARNQALEADELGQRMRLMQMTFMEDNKPMFNDDAKFSKKMRKAVEDMKNIQVTLTKLSQRPSLPRVVVSAFIIAVQACLKESDQMARDMLDANNSQNDIKDRLTDFLIKFDEINKVIEESYQDPSVLEKYIQAAYAEKDKYFQKAPELYLVAYQDYLTDVDETVLVDALENLHLQAFKI